jgi:hypothetical protein
MADAPLQPQPTHIRLRRLVESAEKRAVEGAPGRERGGGNVIDRYLLGQVLSVTSVKVVEIPV